MARTVDKRFFKNYLSKAEEMLEVGRYAIETSKNDAAVAASVHCAINAMDSLAVYYFGRRHSGPHEDALVVIKGALSDVEFKEISRQFSGLMALKNEAEYQPNLMKDGQAADAFKRASRILSKVKEKLP